jgi:hypothetical protein
MPGEEGEPSSLARIAKLIDLSRDEEHYIR